MTIRSATGRPAAVVAPAAADIRTGVAHATSATPSGDDWERGWAGG